MAEPALLLILFGLPGAGKTYVGQILQAEFGFHFHESDEDIPEDYRRRVLAGEVVPEALRDAFHRSLLDRIAGLAAAHPRLAVAVPLLRQKHRDWIKAAFPAARFVLVHTPSEKWAARLAGRQHTVNAEYAHKILPLYEPPELEHLVLENTDEGAASLRRQLEVISNW